MADTHPPGGWPWGKSKQGTDQGSEAQASQSQQQLHQQSEHQSEGDNETTPVQQKEETQSRSAFRSPESVGNKSVKYEDEQPVSVEAPGSQKSFSRTGKEPSVVSNGGANAEEGTETAQSKKDDGPEDEGKDMSEPTERPGSAHAGTEAQSQASQGGSRFSNFVSGASKIVPSFGGGSSSKKSQGPDTEVPDSIRQIQDKIGDDGQTLTMPGGTEGQGSDVKTNSDVEETPGETEDGTETQAPTTTTRKDGTQTEPQTEPLSEDPTEGLTDDLDNGEELRPEDSITHAADNSRPDLTDRTQTGGQTQTGRQTEVQTEGLTEAPTQTQPRTEGQTEYQTEYQTEGQTAPRTQGLTEPQTEGLTEADRTQFPQSEVPQTELPEGATAATEATGTKTEGEGEQEGEKEGNAFEQQNLPTDQRTALTGYEFASTDHGEVDYSILKGCQVNKLGNVVNDKGQAIGRITSGIMSHLIGRKCDENGIIWNDSGKEIGRAEPIPDNELQDLLEAKPFESFEGNTIDAKGNVIWNGEKVGEVVEGDLKAVQGKTVDPDGEILDKAGNVIGKAERWEEPEEPEPEPEAEIDRSILAGKRVNKSGNVVDSSGVIYGRLIDGELKHCVGRMCNKLGEVLSESGDVIGHAELVSEGEREGSKEGPFAELSGLTVAKDGTVVTPSGDIVGRLVSGDPKVLAGRAVDQDGDVLDSNGNVLGHAERWEPEEEVKKPGALAGLRVNNEGNVVDDSGNVVAKLTSGDPLVCAGKEIDDDGDVINSKGMTVGHVNLISEIPEEEEEGETEEEKAERLQREQDKKLATQMAMCLEQCLDKIKPICKMITTKIEAMERKPEDERDEEALVREVRPLIEEGSNILREAHGIIRGLDPDGHIQANAKHKSGTREASSEEFHLAEVIKELTGTVTETIEGAKRKLEDMPHAKKELNPLWGLLGEPLFQIIAAVGLLLSGVLGIVGRLLNGLGLGGIVDGLLGTLGLNRVLDSLGLGSVVGALTGKNQKKK